MKYKTTQTSVAPVKSADSSSSSSRPLGITVISILGMTQETVGSILSTAIAVIYKFLTTYYGRDRHLLKTANGIFVTNPQHRLMRERYYLFPDFHIYTVPYGLEIGTLNLAHQLKARGQSPVIISRGKYHDSDLSGITTLEDGVSVYGVGEGIEDITRFLLKHHRNLASSNGWKSSLRFRKHKKRITIKPNNST